MGEKIFRKFLETYFIFKCPRGKSLYAIYIPTRYTITGHQTDTPFARTTGHGLGREGPTRGRLTPPHPHAKPLLTDSSVGTASRENSSAPYSAGQGIKTKEQRDKESKRKNFFAINVETA